MQNNGGCDLLQWALPTVMEHDRSLAVTNLDAINAYGEIERECTGLIFSML